ncbi:hypothetical protein VTJ83DRAFT_2179 [Remersonia thermophila]|uniref:Uncharacterized protein n=1 Tax=Remersonia thermophila TaxID=72144 RepID=A0ABR4DI43_9PEZI
MTYLGALQSALFYFLACTPCHEVVSRQKNKKQAKREKQTHERIVMEQPHLYRHPDPFQTNPYWAEEIRMGPSLPRKRKGSDPLRKTLSQRRLTSASCDGGRPSIATESSVGLASPRPSYSPPYGGLGSAPTVVPEEDPASPTLSKTASIGTSTADWNVKRYQREDEELWGSTSTATSGTGHKLMDAIKHAGSSAGRYMESKLVGRTPVVTDEDRYNFYFAPRNPPVNDYHPPVVSSKPANKDALRWMLQPPPPAKVMEGKVPVTRSASGMSAASRGTAASASASALASTWARDRSGSRGTRPGTSYSSVSAAEQRRRRADSYDVGDDNCVDDARPSRPSVARTRSRVSSTAARTRSRRSTLATMRSPTLSSSDSEGEPREAATPLTPRRLQQQRPPRRVSRRRRGGLDTDSSDATEEDEGVGLGTTPTWAGSSGSLPTVHGAASRKEGRLPTIMSSGGGDWASSEGMDKKAPSPARDRGAAEAEDLKKASGHDGAASPAGERQPQSAASIPVATAA